MSRPRVVVIGAGMAGLTTARALDGWCEVVVLDKGRGVGGRLATRRIGGATLDHGAQFVTTHTPEFARTVDGWTEAGVLVPWFRGAAGPEGIGGNVGHVRHRGRASMNDLAKHLATGLDVRTATQVSALVHDGRTWTVRTADGGALLADAVVVTAPVPQTLDLMAAGEVSLSAADTSALASVRYDPCIAVMAVLDGPSGLPEPGAVAPEHGPVAWIADNHLKGVSAEPAVTVHATADHSRDRWEDADEDLVDELLGAAGLDARPVPGCVQVQRWRYAKPSTSHPDPYLLLDGLPPLVCAGDAFGGHTVEAAALSGAAAGRVLAAALGVDG